LTEVSLLSPVKESSASTRRPRQGLTKRDQLLETAWQLFYRNGYHATGIDRILAEAGVAKMTLYKHFRSKEELILAVLDKRNDQFRESFSRFLRAKKRAPDRQLLAVFDWLITWVSGKEFRGCFLQKAMAEYQDLHDPIHQAALTHKTAFHAEICRLVMEAGMTNPKALAQQLALLIEGAIVSAHAAGSPMPAVQAREAAWSLIKSARR
jgi:AcrR family transcriptional regulator